MDCLAELECMASNAMPLEEISSSDIKLWQRLFGVCPSEAKVAIEGHRNDLSKQRISEENWAMLIAQSGLVGQGFTREAYEYSLSLPRQFPRHSLLKPAQSLKGTYIVRLEGPLCDSRVVQQVAQLSMPPKVCKGTGEDANALFCEIDALAKHRIQQWVRQDSAFRPTFVRLARAPKELSDGNAPFLGIDTTLPQYRRSEILVEGTVRPQQGDYPVWYFFYGTLGDSVVLSKHISRAGNAELLPAKVHGGRLRVWGGKYRALIDDSESTVQGHAFQVLSEEEENALRFYEGDSYEVVRCHIEGLREDAAGINTNREAATGVTGLTFRFCGEETELGEDG